MAAGLIDADLGGSVYKKRVPTPGRGKRGGARIILGSNRGDRWFFLFGFEKNDRATGWRQLLLPLAAIILAGLELSSLVHHHGA
jgi:hypothetical protein